MKYLLYASLVLVFVLQVLWLAETWYWTVLTMVIGVLTIEALRAEREHRDEGEGTDAAEYGECGQ